MEDGIGAVAGAAGADVALDTARAQAKREPGNSREQEGTRGFAGGGEPGSGWACFECAGAIVDYRARMAIYARRCPLASFCGWFGGAGGSSGGYGFVGTWAGFERGSAD